MQKKESEIYQRMTMMRRAFKGDGRLPDPFASEKKCVNVVMDIIDHSEKLNDDALSSIQKAFHEVENSIHYDGVAWYDFKMHLSSYLSMNGYIVELTNDNKFKRIISK